MSVLSHDDVNALLNVVTFICGAGRYYFILLVSRFWRNDAYSCGAAADRFHIVCVKGLDNRFVSFAVSRCSLLFAAFPRQRIAPAGC